jgi:hypothetical protein
MKLQIKAGKYISRRLSSNKLFLSFASFLMMLVISGVSVELQAQEKAPAAKPDTAVSKRVKPVTTEKGKPVQKNPSKKEQKNKFCLHEFSVWGAGGVSQLYDKPAFGKREKYSFGDAFGLAYSYFFNEHWGILLGGEIAFYNSLINVDNFSDNYDIYDIDGQLVNYRILLKDYKEKQRLLNVNIPLQFQYQTPLYGGEHRFFASLGFKLGIPLSGSYEVTNANFQTTGYYYDWDQILTLQRDLGYGTNSGEKVKNDLDFDLSYIGTAELGVKWKLNRRLSLYTGFYVDYGINNLIKKHNDKFITYYRNEPEN